MKSVEAFWEKRNLGVTCSEVTIEENDTPAMIAEQLQMLTCQYQVVKVPAGRYDLMSVVEQAGFHFIEGSINVVHQLKDTELSGLRKRLNDSLSYQEMEAEDVAQLHAELLKGVFNTDRIYLDPFFTREQAARRYVNWIDDEVARGAQLYKVVHKGGAVGFFIFKETTGGGCYPFLSGLYSSASMPGLGNVVLHKIIEEAVSRGLKYISSYISTNNLPVVKVHVSEGFIIANLHYVYIKHQAI